MRERLGDNVTIDEICGAVGASYRVLNYAFQDAYGTSPGRFLRLLKLHEARRLLKTTDLSLAAIARRVGYSTGQYLLQIFRESIGQTPGEYRGERG